MKWFRTGSLWLGCLFLMACSDTNSDGGMEPLDGLWTGDTFTFFAANGELSNWQIQGISCTWVSPDPNFPEECSRTATLLPAFTMNITGGKGLIKEDDLAIQATLISADTINGSWSYLPSDCCTAVGTWTAHHESWFPPSEDVSQPNPPGPAEDVGVVPDTSAVAPIPMGDCDIASSANTAQKEALQRTNWYRVNSGLDCVNMVATVNDSSQAHAHYYEIHKSAYDANKIPGGAHSEDPSYSEGFTGVSFADRMKAAGYTGQPGFEVIAFLNNPTAAVDSWVETVYHRIPFLSPDMVDTGYGRGSGGASIDVMNFGRHNAGDKNLIVVYPWDGQESVPRSWNGLEWPKPQPPPDGYPSGPVITVHTASGVKLEIDEHILKHPNGAELPHVWLPKGSDNFLSATWAMYSYQPLEPTTKYRVTMRGTFKGQPWEKTWSFTTK